VVANAGELLGLYRRYGVWANLCGHLHVQHVMCDEQGFAEMATSALSVAPNHFARLVATPFGDVDFGVSVMQEPGGDAGEQVWPAFVDGQGRLLRDPLQLRYATAPMGDLVSAWAERQGSDDPNLLDFEAYARAFFDGTVDARNAMILELAYNGFAEAVEMVDFLLETNYAYFCGRLDLVEPQPALVARWREANQVLGYYLMYAYQIAPVYDQNQLSAVLL